MLQIGTKVIVTGEVFTGLVGIVAEIRVHPRMPYVIDLSVDQTPEEKELWSDRVCFTGDELTPIPQGSTPNQIQALQRILCSK